MAEKIKKYRFKLIASAVVLVVLAIAFWYGGDGAGLHGWSANDSAATESIASDLEATTQELPKKEDTADQDTSAASDPSAQQIQDSSSDNNANADDKTATAKTNTEASVSTSSNSEGTGASGTDSDPDAGADAYLTSPVQEGKPLPVESQEVTVSQTEYTCTISISCASILNNMSQLDEEKQELVPDDGWILEPVTVTFYEGESVFNVLQRTMKQYSIQMEFVNTPIYNSAYIEGIGNLYELDVGELSGWTYRVNSWFPNYGCSRYQLQDGDVIEWLYTCDLGKDVGGYNTLES